MGQASKQHQYVVRGRDKQANSTDTRLEGGANKQTTVSSRVFTFVYGRVVQFVWFVGWLLVESATVANLVSGGKGIGQVVRAVV